MIRKLKYSKEIKVKACKDYEEGFGSFKDISEIIGADQSVILRWYHKYKEYGPDIFEPSAKSKSYTKELKLSVVEEYISGKGSTTDLSVKYNITPGMVSDWVNKWYNGIELKDYDPKGDVYTMKSRKTTFEERVEIVKWVIENNMSYKNAADKYSITYSLVYNWTKIYLENGAESLKYQNRGPKPKSVINKESLTEIEKLKLELEKEKALRKRREFELEVLKKKEEFERNPHFRK